MESEQHLLNLTTLELIKMIQELKDENERLRSQKNEFYELKVKWEDEYRKEKFFQNMRSRIEELEKENSAMRRVIEDL